MLKPSKLNPDSLKNGHGPWLIAIVTLLMGVYCLTMSPTVTMEDSGLFITAAYFGGIAHPPGYPLYVMLGQLFVLIPFGSAALKVHILSAVIATAACCCLYACLVILTRNRLIAFIAALSYGLSATFWSFAIRAEVYTLNAFFFFAILALCLKLNESYDSRWLFFTAFLFGLSLTNHWPLILLTSGTFVILLFQYVRQMLSPRVMAGGIICLGLGLLPYLYLIIRSYMGTYISSFDLVFNLPDLWWYISRRIYPGNRVDILFSEQLSQVVQYAGYFMQRFALHEISPLGFATSILGMGVLWLRFPRKVFFSLLLGFLSSTVFLKFFHYDIYDEYNRETFLGYQLVPFGVAVLTGGLFLHRVMETQLLSEVKRRMLAVGLGGAILVLSFSANLQQNNMGRDTFAFDYAEILLKYLPSEAVLMVEGDLDTGPVMVAHLIDGVREDVRLYAQSGWFLGNRLYSARHENSFEANLILKKFINQQKTVYMPFLHGQFSDMLRKHFHIANNGLFSRVSVSPAPFETSAALLDDVRDFLTRQMSGDYKDHWTAYRSKIVSNFCQLLINNGEEHPIFQEYPACQALFADKLFRERQFRRLADMLNSMIDTVDPVSFTQKQWMAVNHFYFLSRMEMINQEIANDPQTPQSLALMIQPVVNRIYPFIEKSEGCHEQLISDLLRVKAQVPGVNVNTRFLKRRFQNCEQLQPLIKHIGSLPQ